jgi:hypothetical protein
MSETECLTPVSRNLALQVTPVRENGSLHGTPVSGNRTLTATPQMPQRFESTPKLLPLDPNGHSLVFLARPGRKKRAKLPGSVFEFVERAKIPWNFSRFRLTYFAAQQILRRSALPNFQCSFGSSRAGEM